MKSKFILAHLPVGVVLALLSCGIINAYAATPALIPNADENYAQSPAFQRVAWEEYKVEKLRHAYYLLEHADRDYSGHRVVAMRSIKKAAGILGVEIKGGGHAEESQWDSDRKVHEAKHLLEDLIDATHGKEQAHIHRAVKELDKALSIK